MLHKVRGLLEQAGDVYRWRWFGARLLVDEPPQHRFSLVPRVVAWLMQPEFEVLAFDPLLVGFGVCPAVFVVHSGWWRVHAFSPVGVNGSGV